jgi:hypothetical protein
MLALTRSLLVGTASFASLLALTSTARADDFGTRPAQAASPIAPVTPTSGPRPETNRAAPPEASDEPESPPPPQRLDLVPSRSNPELATDPP